MNQENIEAIIHKAGVCRLGMLDEDTPVSFHFASATGTTPFIFTEQKQKATAVIEVAIETMTGKQFGFDQP